MKIDKLTLLAILQQAEYDLSALKRWLKRNPDFTKHVEPEKITLKLQIINLIYEALFFLHPVMRLKLALFFMAPIEYLIRCLIWSLAYLKLKIFKMLGLKVIAIAGSYAKTSSKHMLDHCLSGFKKTLKTFDSVNVLFGLSMTILKSLKKDHQVLVLELGEFKPGDMNRLGFFSQADLLVLTPIGRQHLENFHSLDQIAENFKTLFNFLNNDPRRILISAANRKFFKNTDYQFYGKEQTDHYQVTDVKISRAGTNYQAKIPELIKPIPIFSPLYGEHQAVNSLVCFFAAKALGIDLEAVAKRLSSIPYIKRRHEPHFAEQQVLILDNSYNTNPDSIKSSLKLLNELEGSRRFIITAGFFELGKEALKLHYQLGKQLVKQVDYLGLIQTHYTQDIIKGFVENGGKKNRIFVADRQEKLLTMFGSKIIKQSIILFEGGFREIYL